MMPPTPSNRYRMLAAAALALIALAAFVAVLVPRAAVRPAGGFAAYFTSARELADGEDAVRNYDDEWFRSRVVSLVPGASEIYSVNPPTTALVLRPIARLSSRSARAVFVWAGAAALLLAIAAFIAALRPAPLRAFLFVAYALACQPVRVNLREGQIYAILLLLVVAAWLAYRSGRDAGAGACLGLVLVTKLAAPFVWLVPLVRRRLSVVMAGAATAALVVALTLPRFGLAAWSAFLDRSNGWSRSPLVIVTAHQSDASLLGRLFRYDARVNPLPLVDAPPLATVSGVLVAALGIAYLWRLALRDADLAFGAATALGLAVTPFSQSYSYVLALFPAALLLLRPGALPRGEMLALASALLLIGVWFLPFRLDAGPLMTLLSYPKLYGVWILFALCVREGASAPRAP